jgi:hypothetical protein
MTTRFADHLLEGIHSARPAATAVPQGTLYACSTHSLIYQSDGATWSTWASLGGIADILDLATAETDTSLVLSPDGAGGVEFRAEAGGGSGIVLPTVLQTKAVSHGSGGLAMTLDSVPAQDSLLVWIACQNGAVAVPSLANVTWTQLFTDNVGGVGNLTIYTGVWDGSGTIGTSLTTSGGGGLSGALLIELAACTLVGNGSGTIRAGTLATNTKGSSKLVPQDVGSLIAFLVHIGGAAGSAYPILHGAIPIGTPYDPSAQPLMFGISTGLPVVGSYHPTAATYTLAEVRISY